MSVDLRVDTSHFDSRERRRVWLLGAIVTIALGCSARSTGASDDVPIDRSVADTLDVVPLDGTSPSDASTSIDTVAPTDAVDAVAPTDAVDVQAPADVFDATDTSSPLDVADALVDAVDVVTPSDVADVALDRVADVTSPPDVAPVDATGPCAPGLTLCSGVCIDTATTTTSCGACGRGCAAAPGAAVTCVGGVCRYTLGTCPAGTGNCDGVDSNGCESTLDSAAHCGRCEVACGAGESCELVGGERRCAAPMHPRPIAPISSGQVSTRRPTFRWRLVAGTTGAQVEVCRDRACTRRVTSFMATGESGQPAADLPPALLFWRLRAVLTSGALSATTSPVWEVTVSVRNTTVDTSSRPLADFNGDGFADLVVGAPGAFAAYVYLGSSTGLPLMPSVTLTSPDGLTTRFGSSVANAGDLNGDGYSDLIVGAPAWSSSLGRAYVYHGGPTGLPTTPTFTITPPAGRAASFGYALTSAGDLNRDGYGDVAVTALERDTAYVFYGRANGIDPTAGQAITAGPSGANFGRCASGGGDFDGDGYSDLVVGGPSGSPSAAFLFFGGSGGVGSVSNATLSGGSSGGLPGKSVAWLDLNGDGFDDVAMGGQTATAVGVRPGNSARNVQFTQAIPLQAVVNGSYGEGLAGIGDFNRDGFDEAVVGAYADWSYTGSISVFTGGATAMAIRATTVVGVTARGNFGWVVTGGGDFNADGTPDMAVSAPTAGSMEGYVSVFMLTPDVTTPRETRTLRAPMGTGSEFGFSLDSGSPSREW